MINRTPESRVWRNLVVLPSMDAIDAEGMADLGLRSTSFPALQVQLRIAVTASNFDSEASLTLWQAALDQIEGSLGIQMRRNFEAWGKAFPCDSDTVLSEFDAWERTWPDLANVVRASPSAFPWGNDLAILYGSTMGKTDFERKLDERLCYPPSEWDKTCFSRYAGEDLISAAEFFTTLALGADRLQLAHYWKKAAASLSDEQKAVVWKLGQDVWAQIHGAMTPDDWEALRDEFSDEQGFRDALASLEAYDPKPVDLPHPDSLLSIA
ncbi:Hypothetical protein NGAL_HAMBI1146_50390 [Neorhizobium galegae bv. officinalis]|nr:Hypothetical protein NGAL_HAMBI1146_50390 [Neorhizobium galegae bv. officinalis]